MGPASERLEAHDEAGLDGDNGLELDFDLSFFHGFAEVTLHLPAFAQLAQESIVKELHAVLAQLLGAVHGVVRRAQQIVRRLSR